ncbi:MAG: clcD 3 [Chlamydiales bacterium]|jgi:carboxymethylenebutenolidase|nr:clcD 3 [Chlamydiales bacterium]
MKVQESYLDLTTPTGPMRTYCYLPQVREGKSARYAGLLLYSEIFQQTGPIKRLALSFASQGYLVMVPEIYHQHEPAGTVLAYDESGRDKGNRYKCQTKLSSFDADAAAVIQALLEHPNCNGQVGAVGFCIGGHFALRAALHPAVQAAACFYPTDVHSGTLGEGKQADTLQRFAEIKGELLFIWGRQDPHVPPEGRSSIYRALEEAKCLFSWHEVNAEHAFMRDEGPRFDAALARQSLGLALDLFRRALL